MLVAMNKQLQASVVLFIRWGVWVYIILPIMYFLPELRTIESLLSAWMIGSLISVAIGVISINKMIPSWQWSSVNVQWIRQGFKVAGYFLVATLCFRGLLTFDRYLVEALSSIELLGVYVFYIGLIMGSFSFLEPAVFSFIYPKLLHSYQRGEKDIYLKSIKDISVSTILVSFFMAGIIWLVSPQIINWIDKPIYNEHLDVLNIYLWRKFY